MAGNSTTVARLRFSFEGDLKGYRDSLKQAKTEGDAAAKTMGTSLKSAFGSLGTTIFKDLKVSPTPLKDIRTELGQIGIAAKAAFSANVHKAFNAGLGAIKTTLGGIKSLMGDVVKGFAIGIGFGGVQALGRALSDLVGVIPDLITKGREYLNLVDNVADATGSSAEKTSMFVGTLMYLGLPINALMNMFGQGARNLDLMRESLEAAGIATRDATGATLPLVDVMLKMREAVNSVAASQAKLGLTARQWGRSAAKQLTDFLNLSDEQFALIVKDLQRMGLIITESQRNMGEAAVREGARFQNVWTGLGVSLFTAVGPQIMAFFSTLTEWVVSHVDDIKNAVSQAISYMMGLVSSLLGMPSSIDSFSASIAEMNKVTSPQSVRIFEIGQEIGKLAEKMDKAGGSTGTATDALNANKKAIDREIEALGKLTKAEDRVYTARMKNIKSIIDEKLAMLDAAEAARELANQQHDLNEQLNQAQIDLVEAQRGKGGVVDAEAVSKAMSDIAEIRRQQADLAHEQIVVGQRKTLTDAQSYIENITKLIADSDNRQAVAKTLGRKKVALEDQLARATEKGDIEAQAILKAKLDAVNLGIEQTKARLKSDLRKQDLQDEKENLATASQALRAATLDQIDALEAERDALLKLQDAWAANQESIQNIKRIQREYGDQAYAIVGDPKGPVQGSLEKARLAGIKFADDLRGAFAGLKGILDGIIGALNTITGILSSQGLTMAGAAAVGFKIGGPAGALVGGAAGGIAAAKPGTLMFDPGGPLQGILDWYDSIFGTNYSGTKTPMPPAPATGARAAGGPVLPGMPYIVGEKRPEVFVPSGVGTILPSIGDYLARLTMPQMPAMVGGGFGAMTVEVPVYLDGEVITRVVSRRLAGTLAS